MKKLSYKEIKEFVSSSGLSIGENFTYKGTVYCVYDITLVAGVEPILFMVSYFPIEDVGVKFSREINDFKSKFEKTYG